MTEPLPFSEFSSRLRAALSRPLPGQRAQFQMAPLSRVQPGMDAVQSEKCREAGVLALFYPCSKGRAKLLLTVRPEAMNKHAGQVAFPGGRREDGESLRDTALRETEEEIMVRRSSVDVIGSLTPLYIPPSDFCVYPFVGLVDTRPDMSVQSEEVDSMFGIRAHELAHPGFRDVTTMELAGRNRQIPFFTFGGHIIWGATAMMMSELAAVLNPDLLDLDSLIQPT